MDVLGPLPEAPGKVKFVIVVVDYFTKWIEAKPLAKTTGKEVKKFVWDNIVCRYGLPKIFFTDNGTNFTYDPFKSWCKKLNITQINTTVVHPQANDLVKRANRSLMEGIKTRLGRERKGWIKEREGNEEEMRLNLDLLTKRREAAAIREARYKMKMEQYYNKKVRPMSFKVGEYVYRKNKVIRVENLGKLGLKWEGPYLVVEAYQNGSYKLRTIDDREVPRVWHAINLRRCYL
ncbi:reverse transcriptase domain-containing protein [Tanacetum coccineum]